MRSVNTEAAAEQNLNHQKMSDYEKCREERIKENLERMKKLGILDLSLKLKTAIKPTRNNNNGSSSVHKSPRRVSPMRQAPVRRSSRLGNATPVSYSEFALPKKGSFETQELLGEGFKPEAYTAEQKKLLGCTNKSWTLCVDGYGEDGKRVYDPFRGRSCHQCRQKTLGYRTECSQCCRGQGQFCGDCLYTRYGENVLEALENPDWVCPVCRGICNCSLCRKAKGWAPTGFMYRKILKLGFKSVAHYLLQTESQTTDIEKEGTKVAVSAKRSLAFPGPEVTSISMESVDSKDDLRESVEVKFEKNKTNEDHKGEELDGSNATPDTKDEGSVVAKPKDNGQHGENNDDGKVDAETRRGSAIFSADVIISKEDSVQYMENENCHTKDTTASKRKTPNRAEPMPDSIGARLRARRRICSE
ncbi:cell division cycle-associated protein 7 [Heracleum sosnowskyi]|uniref:Cell division cycle-associated protein 7 n=1 Tax=Heracleum sosnowskyi TaxID=360622 RepID=A0AAD8HC73_9APIA|nr:cell division cycle-associated protein 7 [Heracleum sosnowskyi]